MSALFPPGIADSHAPAVNAVDDTSLVAVFSRDEARGLAFLRRHNSLDATVHTSIDGFVDDPRIDLVIVCSPDRLHFRQAALSLTHDKHVLAEKPMTVSATDASQLVELATGSKRTLAVGFRLRFHEGHRTLYERVVNQGEIGTVRHIRAIWAFPQEDDSNWRAKSELGKWWSLAAVGSHCIDAARWFAGSPDSDWKQFASVVSNDVWEGPHDETAVIAGQLSNGVTVDIVSSVNFGPFSRLELFADDGHAICDGTMGRDGAGTVYINGAPVLFEPRNPFVGQLKDVVESIREGRAPCADGSAGRRSVLDLLKVSDV